MDLGNIDRIFLLKVVIVELIINGLLLVILVIQFYKPKNGMFHPKVLRILELCFRTTFYHKLQLMPLSQVF